MGWASCIVYTITMHWTCAVKQGFYVCLLLSSNRVIEKKRKQMESGVVGAGI